MSKRKRPTADEARRASLKFWGQISHAFLEEECGEIDEALFYEAAAAAGLMEHTHYDPAKHENIVGGIDLEEGDPIYHTTPLGVLAMRLGRPRSPKGDAS